MRASAWSKRGGCVAKLPLESVAKHGHMPNSDRTQRLVRMLAVPGTIASLTVMLSVARPVAETADVPIVAGFSQAPSPPSPPSPPSQASPGSRLRPNYVPPGFDVAEDKTSRVAVSQAGDQAVRQQVLLRKNDGSGRADGVITIMVTTSDGQSPDTASAYANHDPRAEMTNVRGKDAATIAVDGGKAGAMIYWLEAEGVSVQVVGRQVPVGEVRKVAEGLVRD